MADKQGIGTTTADPKHSCSTTRQEENLPSSPSELVAAWVELDHWGHMHDEINRPLSNKIYLGPSTSQSLAMREFRLVPRGICGGFICELFCGHFSWKLRRSEKNSPNFRNVFHPCWQTFSPEFALGPPITFTNTRSNRM